MIAVRYANRVKQLTFDELQIVLLDHEAIFNLASYPKPEGSTSQHDMMLAAASSPLFRMLAPLIFVEVVDVDFDKASKDERVVFFLYRP
jgi:hypothetical protein